MNRQFDFTIGAKDKSSDTFAIIGKSAFKLEKALGGVERGVGGIVEAGLKLTPALEPLAAIGSAAGAADMVRRWASNGSSLVNMSSRLGMATDKLQLYIQAAKVAGVDSGAMGESLASLTRNLHNVQNGMKTDVGFLIAFQELSKIGVKINMKNGRPDVADYLDQVASAMKGVSDPSTRVNLLEHLGLPSDAAMLNLLDHLEEFKKKAKGGILSESDLKDAREFDQLINSIVVHAEAAGFRLVSTFSRLAHSIPEMYNDFYNGANASFNRALNSAIPELSDKKNSISLGGLMDITADPFPKLNAGEPDNGIGHTPRGTGTLGGWLDWLWNGDKPPLTDAGRLEPLKPTPSIIPAPSGDSGSWSVDSAIPFLKQVEGFNAAAPDGLQRSWGYGTRVPDGVPNGQLPSQEAADKALRDEAGKALAAVQARAPHFDQFPPGLKTALVSQAFNLGGDGASQLVSQAEQDFAAGDTNFAGWKQRSRLYTHSTQPDGSKPDVPGLHNRRADEIGLVSEGAAQPPININVNVQLHNVPPGVTATATAKQQDVAVNVGPSLLGGAGP